MNRIERSIRSAVNRMSTAVASRWCHSAMRHMLTGHGPTARQRRLIGHGMVSGVGSVPTVEQMKARAAAIDELMASGALDDET